ncbi:hypothetical protein D3C76_1302300 [compost metagenome]
MSEQCTGGVELLPVDHQAIGCLGNARLEGQGVFAAAFGAGIANAPARQDRSEQLLLLLLAGDALEQLQDAELVLWDLPQGRVGSRDDAEYFSQGCE